MKRKTDTSPEVKDSGTAITTIKTVRPGADPEFSQRGYDDC